MTVKPGVCQFIIKNVRKGRGLGILTLATWCYEHSSSPDLRRALVENPLVENPLVENPKENKDHKNVYKLQLKNKLEHYRFFRLSHHGNRSRVFY